MNAGSNYPGGFGLHHMGVLSKYSLQGPLDYLDGSLPLNLSGKDVPFPLVFPMEIHWRGDSVGSSSLFEWPWFTTNGIPFRGFRCTTHFRLPILVGGLGPVHWGLTDLGFKKPMASGVHPLVLWRGLLLPEETKGTKG